MALQCEARSPSFGESMNNKEKTLRLGGKYGITLGDGDWKIVIPDIFNVKRDKETGEVLLVNGTKIFKLASDGKHVFIEIFDQWFIFEPFLRIDWLRFMLGIRSS